MKEEAIYLFEPVVYLFESKRKGGGGFTTTSIHTSFEGAKAAACSFMGVNPDETEIELCKTIKHVSEFETWFIQITKRVLYN